MMRSCVSVFLVLLIFTSTIFYSVTAQSMGSKQPSPSNPISYFWGNSDLSDCWQNFDSEEFGGSSEDGYGEELDDGDGERLEVDFSCSVKENFNEDLFLNPTGKIVLEFGIRVDHAETEEEGDKPLTITLMKGNLEIASKEFTDIDTDEDEQIIWEIEVGGNTTRWNASSDEPIIRFEISKPGWVAYGTPCGVALRCGGSFRMYFSDNQDGMRSQIQFPVFEAPENPIIEEPEDEKNIPGFGLLNVLASVFLGALGRKEVFRRL